MQEGGTVSLTPHVRQRTRLTWGTRHLWGDKRKTDHEGPFGLNAKGRSECGPSSQRVSEATGRRVSKSAVSGRRSAVSEWDGA
jgi:hypothetical protein